MIRLQSL